MEQIFQKLPQLEKIQKKHKKIVITNIIEVLGQRDYSEITI